MIESLDRGNVPADILEFVESPEYSPSEPEDFVNLVRGMPFAPQRLKELLCLWAQKWEIELTRDFVDRVFRLWRLSVPSGLFR